MRILPAIDLKEGKVVRLAQGDPSQKTIYSEDPVEQAKRWQDQGAECLHVVDLDGAFSGAPVHLKTIERIARSIQIPIQVGGGIRSLEDIASVHLAGAERVILGTRAVASPIFLNEACQRFSGRILLGIDAKGGYVAVEGWTKRTDLKAVDLAKGASRFALSGIIYTDISRDGMLVGPNLSSLREMAEATSLPLIASGGISSLRDVRAILSLEAKGVAGMIIGRALYSGDIDLAEAIALSREAR
ncbi:MAG: 1-(5-phosphoribosyl)-5-[(5-phosphoribosylamino)methylideneamino]imidazole-4-carboxamide isomerase [candidate division NC10 bacterium]|nr:1-(5-phosphoribosyl)-5-[(5-phosphoribosylamino)methylideneamino]imidazole-4-carboxamide isomerase [candidate division NC10 bacterium]